MKPTQNSIIYPILLPDTGTMENISPRMHSSEWAMWAGIHQEATLGRLLAAIRREGNLLLP